MLRKISLTVSAIKTTSGNETYMLSLYGGESNGVGLTKIVSFPIAQRGSYQISCDLDSIRGLNLSSPAIFIGHELGGTLPSITYSAWIVSESAH